MLQLLYADIGFLLAVCLEAGSPTEDGDADVDPCDGSMRYILPHIGDSRIPTGGEEHADLWVVAAEGSMPLRFTAGDVHGGTGIFCPAGQHIIQAQRDDGSSRYIYFGYAVYGSVRFRAHKDIQFLQGKGMVLACLDVLQFGFLTSGGNHQQVCAADGTVIKAVLDDVVLLLYNILKGSRGFQTGTGGRGIPIDGVTLIVYLVEGQLCGKLVQCLFGLRHFLLGY